MQLVICSGYMNIHKQTAELRVNVLVDRCSCQRSVPAYPVAERATGLSGAVAADAAHCEAVEKNTRSCCQLVLQNAGVTFCTGPE